MVSTFGKLADTDEYVFFAADSQHPSYELIKNVVNSQNYVSKFALRDYPVTEADILHRGEDAWNAALNTVNIGKYNLGWASIGICTHALYEAITHAANRRLYGMRGDRLPAREAAVHRRLRAARGDEAVRAARLRTTCARRRRRTGATCSTTRS